MKPEKREQYRKLLLELRERVAGQAENVAESIQEDLSPTGNGSTAPVHLADIASSTVDADVRVLQTERGILSDVDTALVRIDDGTYGKCQRCGREIADERLRAIPYAGRCVRCAAAGDEPLSQDDVQED
ncbi:MAG: TraR/DksA family transcriptional regulator [Pirellulaceae bacterium]